MKSISSTALRAAHIIPRGFYSVIVSVGAESRKKRERVRKRERERGKGRISYYKKRSSVKGCKGSAGLSGLDHTKRLYYVSTLIFLVSPPDPVVARCAAYVSAR